MCVHAEVVLADSYFRPKPRHARFVHRHCNYLHSSYVQALSNAFCFCSDICSQNWRLERTLQSLQSASCAARSAILPCAARAVTGCHGSSDGARKTHEGIRTRVVEDKHFSLTRIGTRVAARHPPSAPLLDHPMRSGCFANSANPFRPICRRKHSRALLRHR